MGLFSSGKDKAKEALTWPVRKITEKTVEKYLRQKGKWVSGTCPECGNPINDKRPGSVHKKCWSNLKSQVDKWESKHHNDGTSKSGIHFANCNCNRNWSVHECKGKMGDPI